jgi:hypothetical protein
MGEADFSGYATKAGLKCSDGRTIMPDAFKHMDGMEVPLVWQHGHDSPENVLGHAVLEARDGHLYAYGYFNDTPNGEYAKKLVQHKDVKSLSIYANQLVEKVIGGGKSVFHGMIRELSLVLAGANPGALIDNVNMAHGALIQTVSLAHGDGVYTDLEDDFIIYPNYEIEIAHADSTPTENKSKTAQEIYDSLTEEQRAVVNYMIGQALEVGQSSAAHSDDSSVEEEDTQTDDESDSKVAEEILSHQEGNETMTNVFDKAAENKGGTGVLKHSYTADDIQTLMREAPKFGKLSDAVQNYAIKHGIDDIEILFPDAQTIDNMPQFNKRRTEWVTGVLNTVRHSPFSRVKTIVADITQAEARAKGYIKGTYKIEEWFGLTKRTTDPTTIYKKQKLDRDDVLDITSFDVIAWVKQEMRIQLEEEIARAILLGDGRQVTDDDKITDPAGAPAGDGIRSIYNDHELFVTTVNVNVDDANSSYDEVVDAVMDGMEYYKGTGTPTFYTTIRNLNKFLKAKDTVGRRLYANKQDVAAALGVDQIVTVEPMNEYPGLIGIIVNLDDYTVGADKGGEVSTFEDFDLDYNQQKYLIETRLSGGLTKIKSAIVVKAVGATDVLLSDPTVPTYNDVTFVATIPTMTHVTYKNADTGATLSAGAQSPLSVGAVLNIQAIADAGYYFANDANTLWSFRHRP